MIYTHGGGRLGNQIIRFGHWIAWAKSADVEVLDLAFWPFAELFSVWRQHPGCVFPVRSGKEDRLARSFARVPPKIGRWLQNRFRLGRAVHALGRAWPGWQALEFDVTKGEGVDLEEPAFTERVMRKSTTTCSGWRIGSWRLFAEHEIALRKIFLPASDFSRWAEDFIAPLRARYDVLVGVFIRQSDYRQWHDGLYYYPTAQYTKWMRDLLDLHPRKRIAFVVASEEVQDPSLFEGLPYYFTTGSRNIGRHWFESWVELSLCDFILSPPSTFAATAAFLGGKPIWPLTAAHQVMAFDQLIPDGLIGAARHPEFSKSVR